MYLGIRLRTPQAPLYAKIDMTTTDCLVSIIISKLKTVISLIQLATTTACRISKQKTTSRSEAVAVVYGCTTKTRLVKGNRFKHGGAHGTCQFDGCSTNAISHGSRYCKQNTAAGSEKQQRPVLGCTALSKIKGYRLQPRRQSTQAMALRLHHVFIR